MAMAMFRMRSAARGLSQLRQMSTVPQAKVLVSLAGPDRVGIVKEFSAALKSNSGNMEESKMAQLGGEFAMIALVDLSNEALPSFHSELKQKFPNFSLAVRETNAATPGSLKEYILEIDGPDSQGIVAQISDCVARKGGSIKSMDTQTVPAPFAGFELFKMKAIVEAEPSHVDEIRDGVQAVGEKFGLDIASLNESGN